MHNNARLLGLSMFALAACTSDPADTGDDSSETTAHADTGDAGDTGDSPTTGDTGDTGDVLEGCAQTPVACIDAAIQDLSLQDDKVSAGPVTSKADGADWVSTIDATAGGTMAAAMNPWVYLKFGDDGLDKVEIDDVAALDSSAWDIAAKRYGIRANSGVSGPSCVVVAAPGGTYADITAAPAAASFAAEDYFTDACTLIEDDSGLAGNPAFRMAGWWGYTGCVTTTAAPYVLQLADGRGVKLVVEAYYQEGQAACNSDGAMGSGSAIMTWRWSFLQ